MNEKVAEQKKIIVEQLERIEKSYDLNELFSLYYSISQRTAIILQEVMNDVMKAQEAMIEHYSSKQ